MTSHFEQLLQTLGKIFHLKLRVDSLNACSIQIHKGLTVQLQPDISLENLWIFAKLPEVPPGKYGENLLKEALKANGKPDPRGAIFGYIHSTQQLALYQKYPMNLLNGERLAGAIGSFVELAKEWKPN
jgi:hypothetical protein